MIREATYYQVVCDHCGQTQADLDSTYSAWNDPDIAVERWEGDDGIAVGGLHACPSRECGIAVLSTHPDLVARSGSHTEGYWWVIYDRQWDAYFAFSHYRTGPSLIGWERTLADAMGEVWEW